MNDDESIVRMEYAENIAVLAQSAFRVLESTHQHRLTEQEKQRVELEEKENENEEEESTDDDDFQVCLSLCVFVYEVAQSAERLTSHCNVISL